jgi:hypothetical protein
MTDTATEARRALLDVLLDRVERAALLDNERDLLRPLVAAEISDADARPATQITVHDDATSAAIRPLLADLDTLRLRAEQAEAAVARVRALAEGDYYGITGRAFLAALDGPTPDPDDDTPLAACRVMETRTCPASYAGPCGDRPCARFEYDDPTPWTGDDAPPEPTTSNITDWATSIDEQCPAQYRGDSPHLSRPSGESVDYRCGRRGHGLGTDHATRQDHAGLVFCWTDAIAVYPTTGSES